jgi:LL-diaminopimelate aminotransferase
MNLDWIAPAERIKKLPAYPFARLDELKHKAREQGLDLIDLGMGNPDGATPQPVIAAAVKALQNPANHGYPPFEGTASFRHAITSWYHRRYGVTLDPDSEALPLLGSKEGLGHLALAYINPGDVVLVPSPSYPVHFRGPIIAGGNVYSLILKPENNWLIDLAAIPDAVKKQKFFTLTIPAIPLLLLHPVNFLKKLSLLRKNMKSC